MIWCLFAKFPLSLALFAFFVRLLVLMKCICISTFTLLFHNRIFVLSMGAIILLGSGFSLPLLLLPFNSVCFAAIVWLMLCDHDFYSMKQLRLVFIFADPINASTTQRIYWDRVHTLWFHLTELYIRCVLSENEMLQWWRFIRHLQDHQKRIWIFLSAQKIEWNIFMLDSVLHSTNNELSWMSNGYYGCRHCSYVHTCRNGIAIAEWFQQRLCCYWFKIL